MSTLPSASVGTLVRPKSLWKEPFPCSLGQGLFLVGLIFFHATRLQLSILLGLNLPGPEKRGVIGMWKSAP